MKIRDQHSGKVYHTDVLINDGRNIKVFLHNECLGTVDRQDAQIIFNEQEMVPQNDKCY